MLSDLGLLSGAECRSGGDYGCGDRGGRSCGQSEVIDSSFTRARVVTTVKQLLCLIELKIYLSKGKNKKAQEILIKPSVPVVH